MRQLRLLEDEQSARVRAGEELLDVVQEVVRDVTPKEAAYALGLDAATLLNAIHGRDRKAPPMTWLPTLMLLDRSRRIAGWLAARSGCELVELARRTPEEELRDLNALLLNEGEFGRLMLQKARVKP